MSQIKHLNILHRKIWIYLLILLFVGSACKKNYSPNGIASDEKLNKPPLGFKFPANYEGKPSLQSVYVHENGITRLGNYEDQKKYLPILPFYNDFGRITNGMQIPNYTPVFDNFFEKNTFDIQFLNENELGFWKEKYQFNDNTLFLFSQQFPQFPHVFAFGSYDRLYWYDNFVNINANYLVIYRTKKPLSPEEVVQYLENSPNTEEYLSRTGNNTIAIAHYITPLLLIQNK
jgi:hypothetical protein